MKVQTSFLLIVFMIFCSFLPAAQESATPAPQSTAAPVARENKAADKLDQYYPVSGLDNWNYYYDLKNYQSGTYNLTIKGVDKSGNIYYEGPFNIYIDPKSDIPVVNINNPAPEMRVGGSHLNIVGTCVDDDAVAYVEVKLDEGEFRRVEGKEFWSYYLATEDLEDGSHLITARGVDVNGITGADTTRIFHLDTINPVNTVTSHGNGVLVSGRLKLEGVAVDLNGISKLYLSTDGGNEFTPLKFSYDKKAQQYKFNLSVNTKQMEDGPQIYWFKSEDQTASVGYSAFLFFVDNTNPAITILSPAAEQPVNGKITVSGKVTDQIGIASFTCEFEKETSEIPLIPGNPYWVKDFDFLAVKGKAAQVSFTARDITGNVTVTKVSFPLDKEADKPRLSLVAPENGAFLEGAVFLSGFVADDDGVSQLSYLLDNQPAVTRDVSEAFYFPLEPLKPGKHKLTLFCTDLQGVKSDETKLEFTKAGTFPALQVTALVQNGQEQPFYPGIEILRDAKPVLKGKIAIEDKIQTAEYRFKEGEWQKLSFKQNQAAGADFDIPVTAAVAYGINPLEIRLTDLYMRPASMTTFVYLKNYTRINDPPGIYLSDARLASGKISITAEQPLSALFVGDKIQTVVLEPATELVRISTSGQLIKVTPAREGVSEPVKIKVTTVYGEEFFSEAIRFLTDQKGPSLSVKTPLTGNWIQKEILLSGTLADPSGIQALEYSLDNQQSFSRLTVNGEATTVDFSQRINAAAAPDGSLVLFLKATDNAGNITLKAVALNKDTQPPQVTILAPQAGEKVRTALLLLGRVQDNGRIQAIEFTGDGSSFTKLQGTTFFQHQLPATAGSLPAKMAVRVTDQSGNVTLVRLNNSLDTAARPFAAASAASRDFDNDSSKVEAGRVKLSLTGSDGNSNLLFESSFTRTNSELPPAASGSHARDLLVTGALKFKGSFENGLQPAALFFGNAQLLNPVKFTLDKNTSEYTFNLALNTKELPDGEHTYWIKCQDQLGEIYYAPLSFYADNTLPQIQILAPAAEEQVNGTVTLAGSVSDNTNIRSLRFQLGKEVEELILIPDNPYWSKTIDLAGVSGTSLSLTLTATDLAGNTFTLNHKILIDKNGDLPVAVISYPPDKALVAGQRVFIYGTCTDDDGLQRIEYTLDKGETQQLATKDAFGLDLSELTTGTHGLTITPIDSNGLAGKSVSLSFTCMGSTPDLKLTAISSPAGTTAWETGSLVADDAGKAMLQGETGLQAASGEYAFFDGSFSKLAIKSAKDQPVAGFEIPLSQQLPYGRIDLTIKVKDSYEREEILQTFFYKIAQDDPAGITDGEGIYFIDSRITGSDVLLPRDGAFTGYFNGRAIREVSLEPESDFLKASVREKQLQLLPANDGISPQTKIKVTTVHGRTFETPAYRFFADHTPPVLTVASPRSEDWVRDQITLSGTASDNLGLSTLSYSLDGGATFKPLSPDQTEGKLVFDQSVSLAGLADGNVSLILQGKDETGNVTTESVNFKKDTKPASLRLVTPLIDDIVNGKITVSGTATDEGMLAWVEFSDDAENFTPVTGTGTFYFDLDFATYPELPEQFIIQAWDKSGNAARLQPAFNVDQEIDKPVTAIQVPENAAVLKNDFLISGMVFDDDGVKTIYYQLDEAAPGSLPGSNNFEIPIYLAEITDNEHTIKVWAEDLGGVIGEPAVSTFVISKAEPVSRLLTPELSKTLKDKISLTGTAFDENGIREVFISFDNANTYNLAKGQEDWAYTLDSQVIDDGTHALFIKAVDFTGTEGISATQINIDNTPPEIILDFPQDGDIYSGSMLFDGRAFDNIALAELEAVLIPLESGEAVETRTISLPTDGIFSQQASLDGLLPGWYNVRLQAADKAENTFFLSRNILIRESVNADMVEIIFPTDGAELAGYFNLSGRVESGSQVKNVVIYLDEAPVDVVEVDENGFFTIDFGPDEAEGIKAALEGAHVLKVEARLENAVTLTSVPHNITYHKEGGYVRIMNLPTGSYITERPWLKGIAGYNLAEVDPADEKAFKAYQAAVKANKINRIEVSLDNGKTFYKASGTVNWKYRIETQSIPDGYLRILVRAVYANQQAVTKTMFVVDDKPPVVRLLAPEEGKRINEELYVLGTASDENGMEEVFINLRKGDKFLTSVPSFLQGMYLDLHILGATDWEVGLGFTFFDQAVKLQANIGYTPYQRTGSELIERFYGMALGFKLLANIAELPFSYFFGPDWEFFSMCFAIGADFSYFSMTPGTFELVNPDVPYVIIGSLLTQFELVKIRIKSLSFFNTYSFYGELGVWFISSDVYPLILPKASFGLRLGIL